METLQFRLEKKGRAGKTVTVIEGFTHGRIYLETLASRLKHSCGTGGTVEGRAILIQGDFRSRLREILVREGYQVRG